MKNTNREVSQFDKMTRTPIPQLIVTLSVPSVISMLVNNIYNLVDTAFVGRLGTSASGAVGVVFGFMSILQAFGFMFGQGSGSILSRALGRQDRETGTASDRELVLKAAEALGRLTDNTILLPVVRKALEARKTE